MNTESSKFKSYPVLLLQSRQELAQQLAVSRELTQKVQVENSSDDEEEEENHGNRVPTNNNDNPWIAPKTTSEVDVFVSEYRKYWEERNKKSSVETSSTNEIAAHEKGDDEREIESDIRKGHTENRETAPANKNVEEEDLIGSHSSESVNTRDKNNEDVCVDIQVLVREGKKCSDAINNSMKTPNKQHSTLEEVSNSTEVQPKRRKLLANKENNTAKQINTSSEILQKEERFSPKEQNSTIRKLNGSTLMNSQMKNMSPSKQKSTAEQENDSTEIMPECVLPNIQNTTENEISVSSGMHPKRNISPNKQGNVTEGVNSNVKMQLKRKKLSPKKRVTTAKQVSGKKMKSERDFNTPGYKPEPMECQSTVIATTNSWVVTPIEPKMGKLAECNESEEKGNQWNNENSVDKNTKRNEVEIGKLFDNMKQKLNKKLGKKLKKLKLEMNVKHKDKAEDTFSESDNEGPSLKLKQMNVRADLDEELVEQPHDGLQETESSNTDLNKIVAESRLQEEKQEFSADNIDPSKFIAMKPKHLQTELPDIVTGGDDAIDDNEDDIAERQMTITEAFADDDVVAEFR
jgi:U3 small nucleolar RNA-associated protein 14